MDYAQMSGSHRRMAPRGGMLALLGAGAAIVGLGGYLYKKPQLRKKMLKAKSPGEAAMMMGAEMKHDGAGIANTVMSSAAGTAAEKLEQVRRSMLGQRFATKQVRTPRKEVRSTKSKTRSRKAARDQGRRMDNEPRSSSEPIGPERMEPMNM